jgi:hypothetical protein
LFDNQKKAGTSAFPWLIQNPRRLPSILEAFPADLLEMEDLASCDILELLLGRTAHVNIGWQDI